MTVTSLLAAGAVSVVGCLSLVLARTRAAQDATKAAHTASGQGSILVDGQMNVLEASDAARVLFWPNLAAGKGLTLSAAARELLTDDDEQHHLLTVRGGRLVELSISATVVTRVRTVRGIAVRDVTEQRKGQRDLVHLAHYDSLTGLINRRLFVDRLESAISSATAGNNRVALFYIDLDRFTEVNDPLGHGAGDALLKTLAKRFQEGPRTHRRSASPSMIAGQDILRSPT